MSWFITNEGIDILSDSIKLYRKIVETRLELEKRERPVKDLIKNEEFLKDRIKVLIENYSIYFLHC